MYTHDRSGWFGTKEHPNPPTQVRAQKARGELTPPPYTTILGRVVDTSIKAFIVPARFELSRQALRSGSYNGSNRVRHSTILVNLCERIGFPETTIPDQRTSFLFFFNLEGEQTTGNMNLQSCRVGILVLILFLNGEFFEKSVRE